MLTLITLATILLNAGVFWLLTAQGELERHKELTVATARALRFQLEAPHPDQLVGWKRALDGFQQARIDVTALRIVDAEGRPVEGGFGEPSTGLDADLSEALSEQEERVTMEGSALAGRVVVVTEPLVVDGSLAGAMRLALPWRGVGSIRSGLGFVLLYTLISGLFIGLFGYILFRRRLIAPIRSLRTATRRIADGELGYQVRVDASLELLELCESLNAMSRSLESYRQRTAEQVENLEAANAELRQVQEELIRSEKLASVGRISAGIAHEVGNPLAAVLGYFELLGQGVDLPEMERDLLNRAQRELERIHRIIRELLDYARPGHSEPCPTALGPVVIEAVKVVTPMPAMRGVRVSVDVPAGLPPVMAEADKLHQVIVNLMINAADAIGGVGTVRFGASVQGELLVLECRDSGPGFRAEDLPKVFEPFYTTKEPGRGTGLGLATCQRIVERYGGWIRAANHPEGGALITIGLPRAA